MTTKLRERREFQRLQLDTPISGRFNDLAVDIIEVGVLGARILSEAELSEGAEGALQFEWMGVAIELDCRVMRSINAAPEPGFESGVRFARAIGESDRKLRDLLADQTRARLSRYYEALRDMPEIEFDDDETIRSKDAGFVTYYMQDGEWHKRYSMLPDQPESGFTVAIGEDEIEMKRLRQAYEEADTDGMHLIRLFAELSIAEAMGIPKKTMGGNVRRPDV